MEQNKQHITDIVFVLSLFCVFAVLALFIVVLGANVYQNISAGMSSNYNARTSVSYVTEKVRQNDYMGDVRVGDVDGADALVLTSSAGGSRYETWIYVYGGELKELTVKEGTAVSPGDGQSIMELSGMELDLERESLIKVNAEDSEGYSFSSLIGIKSSGEE